VSTQLRLLPAPPSPRRSASRGQTGTPTPRRRARTSNLARARAARWDGGWRLDARTRAAGREGVAAARAAL